MKNILKNVLVHFCKTEKRVTVNLNCKKLSLTKYSNIYFKINMNFVAITNYIQIYSNI